MGTNEMTPDVDDLLQARLDGELRDPQQQDALRRLEQERPEVRTRAAALVTLDEWLDTARTATPPPDLVKSVMSRVGPRVLEFRRPAPAGAIGGGTMKKGMIGVAAAAALAFVYFAVNGFPIADNSQGAIGAAKRYNAEQITSGDVQVGDTAVQNFIQSETFARLIKDPNAVKLLQDAGFRENLAKVADLSKSGALHDALSDAAFREALAREGLGQALADSALNSYLKDPGFAQELRDSGLMRDLAGKELSKELGGKLASELISKYPLIAGALKDQRFVDAFNRYDLGSALKDAGFAKYLTDPGIAQALSAPAFEAALRNPGFEAALKDAGFVSALRDAGFADALSRESFGQALDQALRGGLKGDLKGGLESELKGDLTRGSLQQR
jgi:hypothetical protein